MRNSWRLLFGALAFSLAIVVFGCGSDGGDGGSSDTAGADAGADAGGTDAGGGDVVSPADVPGDVPLVDVGADASVPDSGGDDVSLPTDVPADSAEDTGQPVDVMVDAGDDDTGADDVGGETVPSVVADDQTADPANEVTIARVVAAEDGWIVVRADDAGGPGDVLGFEAVFAGTNPDVVVALDRDARDGETLWATLHVDAGSAGEFEFPGADAVVLIDGEEVADDFVVAVVAGPEAYIVAQDQVVDPVDRVVVAEVYSVGPGWVVVHEDEGGEPGAVLGHSAVSAGTSNGVTVDLVRDLVDGENLWAMLHVDAGAVGTFDFPGVDAPALDADGAVVVDSFVVSVEGQASPPEVRADDQEADPPNQVTIANVNAPAPGWIVVFEDDGGAPGLAIGHEAVLQGRTTDQLVVLDRDLENGETLWARLHEDAGAAGEFEFPGVDVPVESEDGGEVMDAFVVTVSLFEPHVIVSDQRADPADIVVIDEVLSEGQGWVVVYEQSGAAMGAVIGHAPVFDGLTTDIVVQLARDAVDGETLYAALHSDQGMVGGWEFPGADEPVVDTDGQPIAAAFTVSVPPPPVEPFIVASDQTLAFANEVFVDEVYSVGPGWVVVHEDDGGNPGAAIGRLSVPDGGSNGLYVSLDRDAVDGETLHAMLHVDAGAVGVFEPADDVPATGEGGATVVLSFTVTVVATTDPYVVAEDQTPMSPSEVSIAQVYTEDMAWIAIHEDADGAPGEVIGYEAVFPGENFDIVVYLFRDLVDGETLHALLHVDAGELGIFESPGPDVPATTSGGAPVGDTFVVSI